MLFCYVGFVIKVIFLHICLKSYRSIEYYSYLIEFRKADNVIKNTDMSKSNFVENPEFCAECGSILPLPDVDRGYTECPLCKCQWKAKEIVRKVNWTYEEVLTQEKLDTKSNAAVDGPQVDRVCGSCGNDKMAYSTRQTRSADEGMTVFFTCLKCGEKAIEYS